MMTTFDYTTTRIHLVFFFLTEICQSRWGLNNNSPNLHEKTTNVRILVVVVMKALDKIWGNSRGPLAVKRLSHDVFVLFITILLTLNRKRWQEFCKLFKFIFSSYSWSSCERPRKFVCNELPSKIMFEGGTENNSSFSFETLSENSIS